MMRLSTQRRVALLLRLLAGGIVLGGAIGAAAGSAFRDLPLLGASFGALAGAAQAVILVCAILGTEIFLPRTRLGHLLERAPFLVTLAMKSLVYGAVIVLVVELKPGWRLAATVADRMPSRDLSTAIAVHTMSPTGSGMLRTLLLIGVGVFMLQMSRVVGERTLRDIVLGRYHHARTEERFFLFVDIIGSTPLAERLGPGAVHRFLGEVFRLASDPIGEVHQYVGDEMVITWTVADGREGAGPVACYFAIEQALARAAPAFERAFGAVPRLRAALHAGPVITGEVGGSRRAIVYHGDVMNTTSRIEQATRDLGREFLVSGDALERLADLESFMREDLGPQRLRGRTAAMQIYAVTTKPSTNGQHAK